MKLLISKFSLLSLFIIISSMVYAQQETTSEKPQDNDPFMSSLPLQKFYNMEQKTNFNLSNSLQASGIFQNELKWKIQSFINDDELQALPYSRAGVTTMLPGGFDAHNFGSQMSGSYKLGNTTLKYINIFDYSGNLNSTSIEIKL